MGSKNNPISILEIRDIEFCIHDFEYDEQDDKSIPIFSVNAEMSDIDNTLCISTRLFMHYKDKTILEFANEFVFNVPDAKAIVNDKDLENSPNKDIVKSLLGVCISSLRGIVHAKTQGTKAHRVLMPLISNDYLETYFSSKNK